MSHPLPVPLLLSLLLHLNFYVPAQNMLTHYVPEVKEVKEWIDEEIQGVHKEMLGRIVDHDAAAGSK
jgi:hypothetical protein